MTARGGGGVGVGGVKWNCSYKRITLFICSLNIVIALYVLRSLYASLYVFSNTTDLASVVKYTPNQVSRMEESVRIRRQNKPENLIKLVKGLKKKEMFRGNSNNRIELPRKLKHKISDDIIQRLKGLHVNASATQQKEAIESWRKEKLETVKKLRLTREGTNSTEAAVLIRALESDWPMLLEEVGFWIPNEVVHVEHKDKPEGVDEFDEEVLAGRPLPPDCHAELHTDYDGAAVRWGLTHHKESAADCCQACLDHAKNAKYGEKRCNIWVYCPFEDGCHSPDKYEHRHMECWLKYAEHPRLNFKDKYPESYRNSHPTAPVIVPWVSGVTSV
ncbi:hypothetical protein ACFE04_007200 [Oxalis oulophora]